MRALGLALRAKHRYGVPLRRAFPLVREALNRPQPHTKDPVVQEVLTYLPELDARMARRASSYRPLRRGPTQRDPYRPTLPASWRRHAAIRRAIRWGLDLSLNHAAVREPPEKRLRDLSADVEATNSLRDVMRRR